MQRCIILWAVALLPLLLSAQVKVNGGGKSGDGVADDWQQRLEELVAFDDEEGGEAWEQQYEQLADLYEQKIDLSTATREDFEQLPFLTAEQVEGLCEYLYRYGPPRSLGELAMIESIDVRTRQLLCQFVKLGEGSLSPNPSPKGEGENKKASPFGGRFGGASSSLLLTGRIPFYERKGDKNGYLGYPYRHTLRLTLSGYHYRAGLVGAQDSGEPFLANKNTLGYDHYSYFFQARRLGMLKNLVVGHYRLRLGLGLTMNGNMNLGKRAMLDNVGRTASTITPHASRMSATYLQGAAATIGLKRDLDLTTFVSYRKIDATLSGDTAIRTRLTTGYHRTPSEMERKNNAAEWLVGTRLAWRHDRWHAGLTALANGFNMPLQPVTRYHGNEAAEYQSGEVAASQRYREIYPEGKTFANLAADYGYRGSAVILSGETALGKDGGVATLNTLRYRPFSRLQLMAVQRFYSYRYQALHAASFGENSRVQNESGILVGATWQPARRLTLLAYTDYVYFPWARYQTSQSSHATDHLLEMHWQRGSVKALARYRLHTTQRTITQHPTLTTQHPTSIPQHRLRLSLAYGQGLLTMRTQIDAALVSQPTTSRGWMLGQTADCHLRRLTLNAHLAYFHTDDYESRLYAYERNLRYAFSFPAYFGHGLHGALYASLAASRSLTLTAKLASTHYFDRHTIGSALQQIDHSTQTDLDLQVLWKL